MSSMEDRIAARRKNFKKAVDSDEARRKREDEAVMLRKAKKEEALMKRRNVEDEEPMEQGSAVPVTQEAFQSNVDVIVAGQDFQAVFQSTQYFRKLLSAEANPPIHQVIAAGIVPKFIEYLGQETHPELQFEAAWVLTNIASGSQDQTGAVVGAGALPVFVKLLSAESADVREQAVWALGNIAGDSSNFRDLVLTAGGLQPLMNVLEKSEQSISLMRNATWTLSNLCRGKPPPKIDYVKPALSTLVRLLMAADVEVLTDACWALSYLSDGSNDRIACVLDTGVCNRLVELMNHASDLVQTPALRAVGNIVTGDDHQTEVAIRSGALPALLKLLTHKKRSIRKEACWTISNVTAGNKTQIQAVIDNQLMPPVIEALSGAEFDIKKEAVWALSNATTGGTDQQKQYIVECGCIRPLCDLLDVDDTKIVSVALEALENLLKTGETAKMAGQTENNAVVLLVEECDGLSKIETLQQSENSEIYQKVLKMMSTFWDVEDDEDENITADAPVGGFTFG